MPVIALFGEYLIHLLGWVVLRIVFNGQWQFDEQPHRTAFRAQLILSRLRVLYQLMFTSLKWSSEPDSDEVTN